MSKFNTLLPLLLRCQNVAQVHFHAQPASGLRVKVILRATIKTVRTHRHFARYFVLHARPRPASAPTSPRVSQDQADAGAVATQVADALGNDGKVSQSYLEVQSSTPASFAEALCSASVCTASARTLCSPSVCTASTRTLCSNRVCTRQRFWQASWVGQGKTSALSFPKKWCMGWPRVCYGGGAPTRGQGGAWCGVVTKIPQTQGELEPRSRGSLTFCCCGGCGCGCGYCSCVQATAGGQSALVI